MICRKFSFPKLTQFSPGNNVPDNSSSNTDGCVWRDTCVYSTELKRPYHHFQQPTLEEIFHPKTYPTLTGRKGAGCCSL
jgi:hypothetical protein